LKLVGKVINILIQDLDSAVLPTVSKNKMRDRFATIKKKFDDADKARKALEAKQAVSLIDQIFAENEKLKVYVGVVNKTGNTKALSQAIARVKATDRAALLVAVDPDNSKVNYQCVVSKELVEKGLKAAEWVQIFTDKVGGKNGGNDLTAQGAGTKVESVEEAIKLAMEFTSKLKI
jgi:alanyl-tRNA synthetase